MRPPARTLSALAIALPLLIEGLFLQRYAAEAASWHWYVHLCVGATLALALMTWWTLRHRQPVRFSLLALGGYLFTLDRVGRDHP